MNLLNGVLLSFLFFVSVDVHSKVIITDSHSDLKVIGGKIVNNRTEFAYMVSIRERYGQIDEHFCGGSLISSKYVLTAAHCFCSRRNSRIEANDTVVVGGDLNLKKPTTSTVKQNVSRVILHPGYENNGSYNNDIAIIVLSSEFKLDNVTLSVIKAKTSRIDESSLCVTSGWGMATLNESLSNELRYVELKVISNHKCEILYNNDTIQYTENMLCVGELEGGKDTCQGDSGGPLIYDGLQVGIVSAGIEDHCGVKNEPGVYTDLSRYINWIKDETGVDISSTICIKPSIIIVTICLYFLFKVL